MQVLLGPIGIPESYIDPEKEKQDQLIAAFEGKEMIGCCILTALGSEVVQLRQMAIRPDHQGKQLGRNLLAWAEEKAHSLGYVKVILHARDNVIPFYEKGGYTIFGEPFSEVGIGHHKMEKQV
ncbi:MAG TPA: GNAT family N-acetyltransferase [Flavisolibacter sp.]|nr:GNAT family N-acetyltransferase [Flavisolibacter sp.]